MTAPLLYALAGAMLCGIGLFGLLWLSHLLRKLLAFNIMGSGVFLVMVGLPQHQGGPDPVPQALVLTGIVIAVSATAFALALMVRLYQLTGRASLDETGAEDD